jgi:hypothetical protein
MSMLSIVRIAAFLITAALAAWIQRPREFAAFVATLTLAHYALAMIYSRRQIANVIGKPRPRIYAGLLSVASVLIFVTGIIRVKVLFLPHHVFNEIYIGKKELFKGKEHSVRWLILSSMLLNTALYCTITGLNQWGYWLCGLNLTPLLLILSAGWFGVCLFQLRHTLPRRSICDAIVLEGLTAFAAFAGNFVEVSVYHIVMYHITFWAIYPLAKMWNPDRPRPASIYVAVNVVAVAFVFAISPIVGLPWHMSSSMLYQQFIFWSIFHIIISLSLSNAQPEWLTRFFQGLRPQALVPTPIAALSSTQERPVASALR